MRSPARAKVAVQPRWLHVRRSVLALVLTGAVAMPAVGMGILFCPEAVVEKEPKLSKPSGPPKPLSLLRLRSWGVAWDCQPEITLGYRKAWSSRFEGEVVGQLR